MATSNPLVEQQKAKAALVQSMDREAMRIIIDDMLVKEKTLIEELIACKNEEVMLRIQGEIKGIRLFIQTYFNHLQIDTTDKKKTLY